MATRRWRGAGDERAAGVAAPAIALGYGSCSRRRCSRGRCSLPSRWHETRDARSSRRRSASRQRCARGCGVLRPRAADPEGGEARGDCGAPRASDPETDVVVVLHSDTIWAPGALTELPRPFADPSVAGVTPRQAVFEPGGDAVRRLADWIEDVRYHLRVPPQAMFGQVGCPAGRTIA